MKRKMRYAVVTAAFGALLLGLSNLSFLPAEKPLSDSPVVEIKLTYHAGLDNFVAAIQQVRMAALKLDESPKSVEQLQEAHLACRLAFKDIEYLLEYYDHTVVKNYLNGAPLPSVMPKDSKLSVIEPEGLQVLDELVFAEDPLVERAVILEMLDKLGDNAEKIRNYQRRIRLEHRHVFEAARQELIRVFTLGVTGFDTPGSANALPEARRSLKAVHEGIQAYYSLLDQRGADDLAQQIRNLFQDADQYLADNNDFDSFDRLTFVKAYINPLFKALYQAHRKLGIETIDETTDRAQSTNYHAQNIFSDSLLNPYYFANTSSKDVNPKRIELGRLLFFDPILSSNNERACASCHDPKKGFTDGLPKSMALGFHGTVSRNSPTVVNSVYANRWFLDFRLETLEDQMQHVIADEKEFNTTFANILEKLKKSKEYRQLFKEAYSEYPQYSISPWSVSNAITSYIISLSSFNSPFDQYVRDEREELTEAAKRGFNVFMGKGACGTCHFAPTFYGTVPPDFKDSESEVLGVPTTNDTINLEIDPDEGRYNNGRPFDRADFYKYSFKTTTVRNVALTAPYMHNGVYNTLHEVVDFYNRGGGAGMGIDLDHQTLPFSELNLTDREMDDLVVFMETLTDTTGMTVVPQVLPKFENHPEWNDREIGGEY